MSGSSQVASNGSYTSLNTRGGAVPAGTGFEQSLTQVPVRERNGRSRAGERGGEGRSATSGGTATAERQTRVTQDERQAGDERKGRDGERSAPTDAPPSRAASVRVQARPNAVTTETARDGLPQESPITDAPAEPKRAIPSLGESAHVSTAREWEASLLPGEAESRLGQTEDAVAASRSSAGRGATSSECPPAARPDDRDAEEVRARDGHADANGTLPGAKDDPTLANSQTVTVRAQSRLPTGGRRDPVPTFAADTSSLREALPGKVALDAAGRIGPEHPALALQDEKVAAADPLPLPKSLQDDLMRVNRISQQVLFDKTANVGSAWENGHNFDAGEYSKLDPMKKAKLLASLINTKAVYFAKRDAAVPSRNISNDNEIVAALDRGIKTLHGDPAVQNFFEEQIGPEVRRRMWRPENSALLSRIMKVAGSDLSGGGILQRAAAAGKGPNNTVRSFAVMAGAVRQVIPSDLWQQLVPGMQANLGNFILNHAARPAGEQAMQHYMGVGPLNRASVYDPAIVQPSIALQAELLSKRTGAPQNEALRAVASVVARTVTLTRMGLKLDNAIFKARDEFRVFRSFPGNGTMAWRAGLFHAANAVCSGMQIAANNIGTGSFSAKDKAAIAFQATMAADLAVEASMKYMNAYPATSRSEVGAIARRLQRTYFSPSNIDSASEIVGGVAGLGNAVLSFMSAAKDHDVGAKVLDIVGGIAGLGSNAAALGEAATYFVGHEDAVVTRGVATAVGRMIGLGGALGEATSGARLAAAVISGASMTAFSILGVGAAVGQIIAAIVKGNHATDAARSDVDSRLQRTIGMQIQLQRFTGPGGLPEPWEIVKPYAPAPSYPGDG